MFKEFVVLSFVTPVKTGVQCPYKPILDSGFRRNDGIYPGRFPHSSPYERGRRRRRTEVG